MPAWTATLPGEATSDGILDRCQPIPDCNANGVHDACDIAFGLGQDYPAFFECMAGPGVAPTLPYGGCVSLCLDAYDVDSDNDIDMVDFASFQVGYGQP